MPYLVAVLVSALYYLAKRSAWGESMYPHEGYHAYFRFPFGRHPLRYYALDGGSAPNALANIFFSTAYAHGRDRGNRAYDITLVLTGVCLFGITLALTGDARIAAATLTVYHLLNLAPLATLSFCNAETVVNFMTALGTLVTLCGMQADVPALSLVGAFIATLGFQAKACTFDHLWPLACALVLPVPAQHAWMALAGKAAGHALFGILVIVASGRGVFHRLRALLGLHRRNAAQRNDGFAYRTMLRDFAFYLFEHLRVVLPFTPFLPLYFMAHGPDARLPWLMLALFTLSALHMLVRGVFAVQYGVLTHFPLAFATAACLVPHGGDMLSHPFATAAILLTGLWFSVHGYRDNAQNHLGEWRTATFFVRRFIIDYLKPRLEPGDHIFQDGHFTALYVETGAPGPIPELVWAVHARNNALWNEGHRRAFNAFFRQTRPRWLVLFADQLNLDTLERAYGLRYRLESARFTRIYRLAETVPPEAGDDFDPRTLYSGPDARHASDIDALEKRAAFLTARAQQRLAEGRTEVAAEMLRDVWESAGHLPGTGIAYALALEAAGDADGAAQVLRDDLLLHPEGGAAPHLERLAPAVVPQGSIARLHRALLRGILAADCYLHKNGKAAVNATR